VRGGSVPFCVLGSLASGRRGERRESVGRDSFINRGVITACGVELSVRNSEPADAVRVWFWEGGGGRGEFVAVLGDWVHDRWGCTV
jgi:hypothetical protein